MKKYALCYDHIEYRIYISQFIVSMIIEQQQQKTPLKKENSIFSQFFELFYLRGRKWVWNKRNIELSLCSR